MVLVERESLVGMVDKEILWWVDGQMKGYWWDWWIQEVPIMWLMEKIRVINLSFFCLAFMFACSYVEENQYGL